MSLFVVGDFWLHRDGRRLEVIDCNPDGGVTLRVWGRSYGGKRYTKMKASTLLRVAERWFPDGEA